MHVFSEPVLYSLLDFTGSIYSVNCGVGEAILCSRITPEVGWQQDWSYRYKLLCWKLVNNDSDHEPASYDSVDRSTAMVHTCTLLQTIYAWLMSMSAIWARFLLLQWTQTNHCWLLSYFKVGTNSNSQNADKTNLGHRKPSRRWQNFTLIHLLHQMFFSKS